ncbi:CRISPR-associated endoribonuclease Cas6 [Chitinophaga sp. G-6-1-13]|uniref:CRISPR-associated endoribonuclease Cas6 n=1 Tax=Chitinophaga fulva TaxID=2728842 RepID=A0A848GKU6_9BACT|nr:CRISPR-associated endoribonuclease Cas6 [Chitinophaga fulva]NML38966.1 CRISPR-associated endoribonuclease Cas6 [Chitinophaga fulva]
MRLVLNVSGSKNIIYFHQHQVFLTGALHKWIGRRNEIHGKLSLYSFSWLQNVDIVSNGIRTRDDSYFFIAAYDTTLAKRIVQGVQDDPTICFGIEVRGIAIMETPVFQSRQEFYPASPVFVKKYLEPRKDKHLLFNDPEAGEHMTTVLKRKLRQAGLSDEGVTVSFNTAYPNAKAKMITYKTVNNKASMCPVVVEGTPEQVAFAWEVGVGNCTGIGFGALK